MYLTKLILNVMLFYILFIKTTFICKNIVKRSLIFPGPDSRLQFIFGVGLPVALEDISVTMGYVIKANYNLPISVRNFTNPNDIIERKRRNTQARWNLYNIVSILLQRFGGKSCILRTICEFAERKINKSTGFFEEIFHLILRPSTTFEKLSNTMDKEYIIAEKIGLSTNEACKTVYSECSINLIDLFTI